MKTIYSLVLGSLLVGLFSFTAAFAATSDDKATDEHLHYTAKTLSKDDGLVSRVMAELGFNISSFNGSSTGGLTTKSGLVTGVLLDLGRSNFVVESGLLYRQLGSSSSVGNLEMDYMGVPIMAKLYFNDPEMSTVYIKAGIIPQVLVNNSISTFSSLASANTFDVDLGAGVGGRVTVTEGAGLYIEASYTQGLTNVASGVGTLTNYAFTFAAGMAFDL